MIKNEVNKTNDRQNNQPTALITVKDLEVKTKEGVVLVEPISLTLYAGQNLTILGETGSGKSLLAQAIMGALPDELVSFGEVLFDRNVSESSLSSLQKEEDKHSQSKPSKLWGRTIAMLPQEPSRSLDPTMTMLNQVWETGYFVAGKSKQDAIKDANTTLTSLGLATFVNYFPHQLSGGMAQRASFATATAGGATIIIADEPTKGLDDANKQVVINLLQEVSNSGGALLTITHDIDVARALSTGGHSSQHNSLMVMKQGELLEYGNAEAVLHNPQSDYAHALISAAPHNWQAVPKPTLSDTPLLSVHNVTLARGMKHNQRVLFKGLDFCMSAGEVLGVTGDSGIGKSSLGDALCGLLKPVNGSIEWHGAHHPKPKREKVLKLYQDPPSAFASHLPLKTLLNDVIKKHKLDARRVPELLHKLKLHESILSRSAINVSGGELQRVAILRALLFDPVLLIADEVTSRLDPITQKETLDLLTEQCRAIDCALMMVCHDKHVIEHYCHQVVDLAEYC